MVFIDNDEGAYESSIDMVFIDNDEGAYESSRDAIREGDIKNGESYKEWFKEYAETDKEGFYKVYDGWSERELDNEVDWDEIK